MFVRVTGFRCLLTFVAHFHLVSVENSKRLLTGYSAKRRRMILHYTLRIKLKKHAVGRLYLAYLGCSLFHNWI